MRQKKIVRRKCVVENLFDTAYNLHPRLKNIYLSRGVQSSKELDKSFTHLLPFYDLLDIEKAAEILFQALLAQQHILIVGDYDVDGATSTALMVQVLTEFGFQHVDFLIPNRFSYGYGLSPEIVDLALNHHPRPDLIITVDNGISSISGVNAANQKGVSVIITDHHLPGETLPDAAAIVNPNRSHDPFLSKNLAGVGVAFYLLLALRAKLRDKNWFEQQQIQEPNLAIYLDLVALGTVADMVPLDHNNRILVHQGIERIRAGVCCLGIKALIEVSTKEMASINTDTLSYLISPKLNAAGRLDDMSLGVNCLLAKTEAEAERFAHQLERLNKERRNIERDMQREAFAILDRLNRERRYQSVENGPLSLCLMDENWHEGVIGILASRLKEAYHRPVVVFAPQEDGKLKGSARSISQLHIRDVLENINRNHPSLIERFGGHAQAAGLSLQASKLLEFTQKFEAQIKQLLKPEDLEEVLMSDGELDPTDMHLDFAKQLQASGPWGIGFPEPLFEGNFELIRQQIVAQNHLKMILKQNARIIDAIAFNVDLDQWPNQRCEAIYALYRLTINEYKGRKNIQLIIKHFEAL
ncbi:MAG: single-stranded-DNA-specific exonuclease RecJ [Gammaproteobacteria bacterium]|nr:single-stranded-DNA-specific exonuclease RecJ [Gammaproteobacteria bacterium]